MEQNVVEPFESLQLNYELYSEIEAYIKANLKPEQIDRLNNVLKLLVGFESTFSLELLASLDSVMSKVYKDVESIYNELWSKRKKQLFNQRYVSIARERLSSYSNGVFETAH